MTRADRPEVTVIIPYYNHAGFLKQCLDSLDAQTYPNFSLVVVDDGSHRDMRPAVDGARSPVRVIHHETNRGPAAARNTGISSTSAPLFVCIDADDHVEPEFLARLVEAIEADDAIDCAFGDVRLFGAEERIVTYDVPTLEDILRSQAIPGAGTMMRRRLWERLEGYDEAETLKRGREDWEFYIRAFSNGCSAAHVGEALYNYRISNKSLNATCRMHDAEVAEYIYGKHKELFDRAGEAGRFLSFGYEKAARAWYHHGDRRKAIGLAYKSLRRDVSPAGAQLLAKTLLPESAGEWVARGDWRRNLPLFPYPYHGEERYRPFFVVGSGRSGSTLFRRVLTAHSELHIPPENFELGSSIRKFRQFRGRMGWYDLSRFIMSLFEFHHEFYTFETSLRPLVNRFQELPRRQRNLAYLLDALYRFHGEQHGQRVVRWGDKTPLNTYDLETLELILKVFPDAQFIHLVRHGCDVIASTMRYGFFTELDVAARRWVRMVDNAHSFTSAHQDRSLLVRYEDLVSKPEATIRGLCDFLGVALEPAMLTSEDSAASLGDVPVLREHLEVSEPINVSNVGKGRLDFSAAEREQLQEIIGARLAMFGYPPATA